MSSSEYAMLQGSSARLSSCADAATPYFMPAVFSSGPIDKVSEWGNCLLSTAPGQGPDPSRLSSLHLTNKRGICGYSFKKGDICWNCRCGCRSI